MKQLLLICLALWVGTDLSAGNSRSLEWFDSTSSAPDFDGSFHREGQDLPVYFESMEPQIAATAYDVRLTFPVYEKLTPLEIKSIPSWLKSIPDSIQVEVSMGTARKKTILDLTVLPFVRRNGVYYKLTSFDWDIKPRQATTRATNVLNYAANSVLATGKWRKISITESGMYKLTYSDIKNMGMDPNKVQIYGYGGKLLAENFSLTGYLDDLPEVAVYKELGSDGVFNAGDFIVFYAQGPVSWSYNTAYGMYLRTRNHYSDKAYYFVGERSEGTLTTSLSTFIGTANKEVTSFTDFQLHENEWVNLGESVASRGTGRQLFGEDFIANNSRVFSFDVPNPDTTANAKVLTEFAVNNQSTTYFNVFANNAYLYNCAISGISASYADYQYANEGSSQGSFKLKKPRLDLQIDYNIGQTSSKSRAYLNAITLNARRFLKMYGSILSFRDPLSVASANIARFAVQNATSKLLVFDVTDQRNMIQMNGTLVDGTYSFVNSAATLHDYVAVDLAGAIPKPTIEKATPNQNLHAQTGVDMVILAPSEFLPHANKLADAHRSHDGLKVLVVTPEQVYNEFSSGTPDATAIRRMMKLYYDRGQTESELPRYLLLFGDGVYDNRLVSTVFANQNSRPNKILTYQSVESSNGYNSFVTDDYFGFLDDSEGASLGSAKLDIGIGRFPVNSAKEAEIAVEKAISYMYNNKLGAWKNRLLFLADDGDSYLHVTQADALAGMVGSAHPEFMINKIYVDTYTRVTGASGVTVPDANTKFAELMDAGLLMLNYTGHGSTSQWAEEKLLLNGDIAKMNNRCLPLWVTATCDFTRYDALETSGGELVFLKENGGGIALFTTTRIVLADNNFRINKCFLDNIFAKNNGVRYSLGDIMNLAKRNDLLNGDANKLSFTLIGDPALKLGYPEYAAQVTHLNGKEVSMAMDTLQALSTVTVSGKILREDGTCATDFNGLVSPSILDAAEEIAKLERSPGVTVSIYDRSKVLFSGKDSVRNGLFTFSFVVPKDNSYSYNPGRINLYASDESGKNEAQGFYSNFVIGGTDRSAIIDRSGPQMALYLNDESFADGGTVQENPILIARISDENGLSTSGNGIGHDLMLVVDDLPSKIYNLNNFFSADVGSYQSGVVRFQIPELTAGRHKLTFRAWDVQNNSSTDTLYFVVKPGLKPEVSNLQFFQQGGNGQFLFTHNRPMADVSVNLSVFDLLGRVVWQTDWNMLATTNASDVLKWNLTDANDRRIANGVYICRIIVTDTNGSQNFGSKKILVTGQ